MDSKIEKVATLFPEYVGAINQAHKKLDTIEDVLDVIKRNESSINEHMNTVNKNLEDLKHSQEEEQQEMKIKIWKS